MKTPTLARVQLIIFNTVSLILKYKCRVTYTFVIVLLNHNSTLFSEHLTVKADSHIACRAAKGFRTCLSPSIHTVQPCLIHTCRATPTPFSDRAVLLEATARSKNGMGTAWRMWIRHGRTVWIKWERHPKPLAARHGRGMACYVWISLYCAELKRSLLCQQRPKLG